MRKQNSTQSINKEQLENNSLHKLGIDRKV